MRKKIKLCKSFLPLSVTFFGRRRRQLSEKTETEKSANLQLFGKNVLSFSARSFLSPMLIWCRIVKEERLLVVLVFKFMEFIITEFCPIFDKESSRCSFDLVLFLKYQKLYFQKIHRSFL